MKKLLWILVILVSLSASSVHALITPLDFYSKNDISLIDDMTQITVLGNTAYLTSNSSLNEGGLAVFDVSDPSNMRIYDLERDISDGLNLSIVGNRAYMGQRSAFSIYDITDPDNVEALGKARRLGSEFPELSGNVKVVGSGTRVFAMSESGSNVSAYETSDPQNITLLGFVSDASKDGTATHLDSPRHIEIKDNYLLIENNYNILPNPGNEGITVIDINNPANMSEVGHISIPDMQRMRVFGNKAYVTVFGTNNYFLRIYDLSNPNNMSLIKEIAFASFGFTSNGRSFSDFFVVNNKLYYTNFSGFGIFDISDLDNIILLDSISDSDATEDDLRLSGASGIYAVGDTVFVYTRITNNKEEAFSTFNFDEPEEQIPPTVSQLSPSHNEVDIDLSRDFIITFNEPVQKSTGSIFIQNPNRQTIESIAIESSKVTVNGSQVTINPESDFADETQLSIIVTDDAFTDLSNNPFAGIRSKDWLFTSENEVNTSSLSINVDSKFVIRKGFSRKLPMFLLRDSEDINAKARCSLRTNFSKKSRRFIFKKNESSKKLTVRINKKIVKAVKKAGDEGTILNLDFQCGSDTLSREIQIQSSL